MEPALDERGDLTGTPHPTLDLGPQWSPLSTSGATTDNAARYGRALWPQWSPLSTSGATRRGRGCPP